MRHILLNLGRGWLVLWMLAIPIIHIHPEVDHAHGAHQHNHSAQYHSLFSEDHLQEFHEHSHPVSLHHSRTSPESIEGDHVFDHVFHQTEIGFSFLNKSGADPIVPQGPAGSLVSSKDPSVKFLRLIAETYPSRGSPPNWLFVSQHRVRPPPQTFLFSKVLVRHVPQLIQGSCGVCFLWP